MARRKKLTHLKVREGSLVDNPANPGARVLLFKRNDAVPEWLAVLDRAMAMLRSELVGIIGDEPVADRDELIRETIVSFLEELQLGLPVDEREEEETKMPANAELDRMLRYSRAGGVVHSWSETDVFAAMSELASKLSPGDSVSAALAKNYRDEDMQRLYELYKNADREEPEEPVTKAPERPAALAEIEALARALAARTGLTFERAVDRVMVERPELYARYREQLAGAINGAAAG